MFWFFSSDKLKIQYTLKNTARNFCPKPVYVDRVGSILFLFFNQFTSNFVHKKVAPVVLQNNSYLCLWRSYSDINYPSSIYQQVYLLEFKS